MGAKLLFRVLTPQGERFKGECDAVDLWVTDDAAGNGGGSMGILPGHIPAVAALEEGGRVKAVDGGNTVYSARIRGGYARVDRESVTVLTPETEELNE